MIEQLQADARNTVSVMEQGKTQASQSVDQAGTSLNQITQMVEGITDMNTQIASAAEEQSAVSDEINRNIITINKMAEHTASGANQAAASGEHMQQLASDLRGMVNQFKV